MYCENCGAQLKDGVKNCPICGSKVLSLDYLETDPEDVKESKGISIISKFVDFVDEDEPDSEEEESSVRRAVTNTTQAVTQKIDNYLNAGNRSVDASVRRQQDEQKAVVKQRKDARTNNKANQSYMSNNELWTWLKKNSKQKIYYTPLKDNDSLHNSMQEKQFIEMLQNKMNDNSIPAVMKKREVVWDRSDIKQSLYVASLKTESVNPLTYYVSFNHVGNFTFVDERTFITPPNLPDVPLKPLPENKGSYTKLWRGALFGIAGIVCMSTKYLPNALGFILLAVGIAFLAMGYEEYSKVVAVKKHNMKCLKMEAAWEAAWDNWKSTIFTYAFQEDINGEINRIYESISATVEQICSELFKENQFREQDETANMNDLEQMVQRRQEEYR